jgi:hypothetical protein
MNDRRWKYGWKSEANERRFYDQAFTTAIEPGPGDLLHLAGERLDRNIPVVGEQIVKRAPGRHAKCEQQEQKPRQIRSYMI